MPLQGFFIETNKNDKGKRLTLIPYLDREYLLLFFSPNLLPTLF
jgi:hypothetical protein